jgi:hypothetical protein
MQPSSFRLARLNHEPVIEFRAPYSECWPFTPNAVVADRAEGGIITGEFPRLATQKSETHDLFPEVLHLNTAEGIQDELRENLILKVWADVIVQNSPPIQLPPSVAKLLNQQMSDVFTPLLSLPSLREEIMDLQFHHFRGFNAGYLGRDITSWLWKNGWPLHYVMGLLERMEEIRAAGELDAALLHPIHAELLHWMPLILARLEEIAAAPGPTSQRLAAAITTMRLRIPRLRELQAATGSNHS